MLEESRLKERGPDLYQRGHGSIRSALGWRRQLHTICNSKQDKSQLNNRVGISKEGPSSHQKTYGPVKKLTKAELDCWRRAAASKRRSAHFE